MKRSKTILVNVGILLFCSLYSLLLSAKNYKEQYSITVLDFYTPVLSEAENRTFFDNLMEHLKVYAIYCTKDDAPRLVLRKERVSVTSHSHTPAIDFKEIFKRKTRTEYRKKCQAIVSKPKHINKNVIQLNPIKEYRFYNLIGFQLEIPLSFTNQYTLLNTPDGSAAQIMHERTSYQNDYYYLVTKADRFFFPLEKINTINKTDYTTWIAKSYRSEELLKSVGLRKTPMSIMALVANDQNIAALNTNDKFTANDKIALINRIEFDNNYTEVDLKNSFNIHSNSKIKATYAKAPDVEIISLYGKIDKDAEVKGIEVKINETWRSYKGNVVSIRGNLESRTQFNCKVTYQLNFYPDGTSNKAFEVYTGHDVLKSYDGTQENIKNMKQIIQQYQYTKVSDPLNECDKVVEYVQLIFSSSPNVLSKKMQEMGDNHLYQ